jgi:predicted ATPase/class 3 adenylate cyclase
LDANSAAATTPALLPSGTVTFAFTDVEGSTARWERDRPAMQDALRRHDALVRGSILKHGGHVFKTIGDAFCAVFQRPEPAVAALLDAQAALSMEDFSSVNGLQVRAAVHTGTADERDGDYFGPALNRVARLLAIGHGGQVLVSGVAAELVRGALPPQASLRDLGTHRLKDIARPEQVYQLVAPRLASDFPPLRSLSNPSNMHAQLTSFVGRDAEIAEIAALLCSHRLVTLTGSGGIGKTRASLQAAANVLDVFVDGVWFIELAPLRSGDYIPTTIAQVLDLTLRPVGDDLENLVFALTAKNALLLLDNCEHLLEATARSVAAILRDCPGITILATSRQGLGIGGEETYRLPPLETPSEDDARPVRAADVAACAAVVLFVERARAVNKRFGLTDENAAAIAEICRRLDGIPLAIELAASRVNIMGPRQLRERLAERFRLLTGGSRDVLPRQQTLRALIDWSHDLLDERERVLFRRLGIFVNGFMLEGAVAVGCGAALDEFDVLVVLSSLVDKSLVLAEPLGDSIRYRLLESTRVYAFEKASDAGEGPLLASRHLTYLRDRFAEIAGFRAATARESEGAEALRTDLEDVRAALDEALTRGDHLAGGALLVELGSAWSVLGLNAEGISRAEAFLAAVPRSEALLAARLSTLLCWHLIRATRKVRALEVAVSAVALARESGDRAALAGALAEYSWINLTLGRPDEAEKALAEAEAIPGTSRWLGMKLQRSRAFLCNESNDVDRAARIWARLRTEHRVLGNVDEDLSSTLCLAEIEYGRGDTLRAVSLAREALESMRSRETNLVGTVFANLAAYLVTSGDLAGSAQAVREVARLYAAGEPDQVQVAFAIEVLACVHALRARFERAALLEGYVEAALQRLGASREFTEKRTHDRLATLLRDNVAHIDLERIMSEGAALSPRAAVALALEEDE